MQTGECEPGGGVVKGGVGPRNRVMAALASRRESRMWNRADCIVVIGLMATHAGRVGDVVIVVDVAIRALTRWHGM